MSERRPEYDPPYDSPSEDAFAWGIVKYLEPSTRFEKQVEVRTMCGTFRPDFVLTLPNGNRIGIECDGEDFHDAYRDEWRDAIILGERHLNEMIRFRGRDLYYRLDDCLYILQRFHPAAFSDRGRANLTTLASDPVKAASINSYWILQISYGQSEGPQFTLQVERRRAVPLSGEVEFWQTLFEFARKRQGRNLDQLIHEFHKHQQANRITIG